MTNASNTHPVEVFRQTFSPAAPEGKGPQFRGEVVVCAKCHHVAKNWDAPYPGAERCEACRVGMAFSPTVIQGRYWPTATTLPRR